MSTRAVYTFKDGSQTFAVYKHHDGYPSGAASFIKEGFKKSWGEGRFEASELAAAFVAANKEGAGGVYLTKGYRTHGDLSYDYVIRNDRKGGVTVEAYKYDWIDDQDRRVRFFAGSLESFVAKYIVEDYENQEAA
jgi:hypothetical protein